MNQLLWTSILFSPLIDVGVVMRFDQLLCPVVFASYLATHRRVQARNPGVQAILFYALASAAASLLCVATTNNSGLGLAIRWPLVMITNVMAACAIAWSSKTDPRNSYRKNLVIFQWLLFFVGLIGLVQVAEHRHFIGSSQITAVLSYYYPYRGELSSAAFHKAFNKQLKTGGAGRLTSVVDGHPILAGDLLAIGLLITMPLARGQRGWLLHAVPVVALVLTLSRGSIAPWFIGVLVYSFLITRYSSATNQASKRVMTRLLSLVGLLSLLMLTPLGDSILWRIESSIDTFHGGGVSEGRTDEVWPEVMEVLANSTKTELILGLSDTYDGPTDSQYLLSLVYTGLFGVAALLALHVVMLLWGYREAMTCLREKRSPELAFAFMAAVCALLVLYFVHPTCQNRRLLSVVVAAAVLLFQAVPKYHSQPNRKDARSEAQCRPSLHRAYTR